MKKYLGRSIIYLLGDFVVKGPEFLLVPIYTRFMLPEDYGSFIFITSLIPLSRYLLGLGIQVVALKFYFDYDNTSRKQFYGTIWIAYTLTILLLYIIVISFSGPILELLDNKISYTEFVLMLINAFFITTGIDFFRETLKAEGKAIHFSSINIILFASSTALTILLFIKYETTPFAALIALNLASFLMWVYCTINILKRIQLKFRSHFFRVAFLFGIPMVPHLLSHWVLNSSDKLFLGYFFTLDQLASYNVAFVIGWSLSLFKLSITNSLVPLFGELKKKSTEANKKRVANAVTVYILTLFTIASLIIINANVGFKIIAPSNFSEASSIVPIVVLAALLLALYNPSMMIMNIVVGNSKIISLTTLTSMLLTLASAIYLIPRFGIIGASSSLVVGYLFLSLKMYLNSQKYFKIDYSWSLLILIMMFFVGLSLIYILIVGLNSSISINNLLFSLVAILFSAMILLKNRDLLKWS